MTSGYTLDPTESIRNPNRLQTLRETGLLDTLPDQTFDRITRLATQLLQAPIALVSLVDEDRQFFKSAVGLQEPWATLRETPLLYSFCQHVVTSEQALVVDDARQNPLVAQNLAVRDLGVVAYAGAPLRATDGCVLGALCVIDTQTRAWSADKDVVLEVLSDLATAVVTEIELRTTMRRLTQKMAEVEEERSQRLALLNSTSEGIYGLDLHGRCTFINRIGAEMLGYRPSELIGQNMHQMVHHTDKNGHAYPESNCPIREVYRLNHPIRLDDEILWRRDNTSFPVQYGAAAIREGDSISGVVVTFSDITVRKRSEALLRGQSRVLELIASGAPLPYTLETLALMIEEQTENLLASILLYVEQTGLLRLGAAPSLPDAYNAAINGLAVQEGAGSCGTAAFRRQRVIVSDIAGDPLWNTHRQLAATYHLAACWSAPILNSEGRLLGTFALYYNEPRTPTPGEQELIDFATHLAGIAIERKHVEEERIELLNREKQAREEAEQALQLRDQFVSVAAHELKTPVTALVGYTQLLQRRAEREGDQSGRYYQAIIALTNQARRLQRLSTSLLDLSRLQSGQLSITTLLVDIAVLVQRVVEELRPTLSRHTISVEGPAEGLIILGDELRLEQVLFNLLSNAIKYSPDGGEISVFGAVDAHEAAITISDPGIGIPQEALPSLFDPYFRAPNVNIKQISGMGLGLYVVKEILNLHGGSVSVSSSEGQGSSFTIRLPLCDVP